MGTKYILIINMIFYINLVLFIIITRYSTPIVIIFDNLKKNLIYIYREQNIVSKLYNDVFSLK